jgi:hypothetical protein
VYAAVTRREVIFELSGDGIRSGYSGGNLEEMLLRRSFNERENERRQEHERWKKQQEEAELRMSEITRKEREHREKVLDEKSKNIINGGPFFCLFAISNFFLLAVLTSYATAS